MTELNSESSLSPADWSLLTLLSEDASLSYAQLGEKIGLSAAAAHERVKKLRASGHIRGTVAVLDFEKLGRAFLAFVQLKTDRCGTKAKHAEALAALPEIEEIHSIAGEFSLLVKARTRNAQEMEALFPRIFQIEGIIRSETVVVFSTYLDRPIRITP